MDVKERQQYLTDYLDLFITASPLNPWPKRKLIPILDLEKVRDLSKFHEIPTIQFPNGKKVEFQQAEYT